VQTSFRCGNGIESCCRTSTVVLVSCRNTLICLQNCKSVGAT
jgi:hypothetical protein